ncbi:hypothetical protein [Corynebacterium sp. AOP12-C2-36]|uniref:hypothetical protein n=1 Tax=Corynebacterium sp. AOP12-C2-36 TaxID=3457723 RepID=UPI0040340FB2
MPRSTTPKAPRFDNHVIEHRLARPDDLSTTALVSAVGAGTHRGLIERDTYGQRIGLSGEALNYLGQRDGAGELITLVRARRGDYTAGTHHALKLERRRVLRLRHDDVAEPPSTQLPTPDVVGETDGHPGARWCTRSAEVTSAGGEVRSFFRADPDVQQRPWEQTAEAHAFAQAVLAATQHAQAHAAG